MVTLVLEKDQNLELKDPKQVYHSIISLLADYSLNQAYYPKLTENPVAEGIITPSEKTFICIIEKADIG